MKIQPIVEGYGEVQALPILLRRLRDQASAWDVEIKRPMRCNRSELVGQPKLEKMVKAARYQPDCNTIFILFDGDRDCPAELGPRVHEWASAACGGLPCEVVMPHKEYEAWFNGPRPPQLASGSLAERVCVNAPSVLLNHHDHIAGASAIRRA